MLVVAVLLLVVLGAAAHGLRTAGGGPRWPFLAAAMLSGAAVLTLGVATVVALVAGRDTWNSWVSGSRSSQTVTLWLVLVVGPVLLVSCWALVIVGAVLRSRQRLPSEHAPDGAP